MTAPPEAESGSKGLQIWGQDLPRHTQEGSCLPAGLTSLPHTPASPCPVPTTPTPPLPQVQLISRTRCGCFLQGAFLAPSSPYISDTEDRASPEALYHLSPSLQMLWGPDKGDSHTCVWDRPPHGFLGLGTGARPARVYPCDPLTTHIFTCTCCVPGSVKETTDTNDHRLKVKDIRVSGQRGVGVTRGSCPGAGGQGRTDSG